MPRDLSAILVSYMNYTEIFDMAAVFNTRHNNKICNGETYPSSSVCNCRGSFMGKKTRWIILRSLLRLLTKMKIPRSEKPMMNASLVMT